MTLLSKFVLRNSLYQSLFCLALGCSLVASTATPAHACPNINGLVDRNCDGRLVIAAFGDSITVGVGDSQKLAYLGRLKNTFFPNATIRNFGKSGEKTNAGRTRATSVFSKQNDIDYIIILQGVNDFFLKIPASQTRSNIQSIDRTAKNTGGITSVSTLTDIRRSNQRPWVLAVNNEIRPFTKIDFFSLGTGIISGDLLHPNDSGYQKMAEHAAAKLFQISEANRPADSDGDGVFDFMEIRLGTNPFLADTDGDGVSDFDEIYVYGTNPLLVDTDGDGISDFVEIFVRNTDPRSKLPKPPTLHTLVAVPDHQ